MPTICEKFPKHCECAEDETLQALRESIGLHKLGYVPGKVDGKTERHRKIAPHVLKMVRESEWFAKEVANDSLTTRTLQKLRDVFCRWPRPSEIVALFAGTDVLVSKRSLVLESTDKEFRDRVISFVKVMGSESEAYNFTEKNDLIYVWVKSFPSLRVKKLSCHISYFYVTTRNDEAFEARIDTKLKRLLVGDVCHSEHEVMTLTMFKRDLSDVPIGLLEMSLRGGRSRTGPGKTIEQKTKVNAKASTSKSESPKSARTSNSKSKSKSQ